MRHQLYVVLRKSGGTAFLELSYDGEAYTGFYYGNRRANGIPISETRVSQLLRSGAYPAGTSVLSAGQFGAVLKRLGVKPRRKPKQRR